MTLSARTFPSRWPARPPTAHGPGVAAPSMGGAHGLSGMATAGTSTAARASHRQRAPGGIYQGAKGRAMQPTPESHPCLIP